MTLPLPRLRFFSPLKLKLQNRPNSKTRRFYLGENQTFESGVDIIRSSKVVVSDSSKVEMSDLPYATPLGIANGSGFESTWNNYDEYGRT